MSWTIPTQEEAKEYSEAYLMAQAEYNEQQYIDEEQEKLEWCEGCGGCIMVKPDPDNCEIYEAAHRTEGKA